MARPTTHNTAQERIEALEKNKHYYAKYVIILWIGPETDPETYL
jgi:hypothetical protein